MTGRWLLGRDHNYMRHNQTASGGRLRCPVLEGSKVKAEVTAGGVKVRAEVTRGGVKMGAEVTGGHNYMGHNYVGHDYIGHTYIGHNCIGLW